MNLTANQLQAAQTGQPVRVLDRATDTEYVLIRADLFERASAVFADGGLDEQQVARLVDENMREDDEADPLLASYQKQQ